MRTFAVFALLAVAAYAQIDTTTPDTTLVPDVHIIIKDAEIVKRQAQPSETTPEPAIPADHVVVKRQYTPEEQQEVISNEPEDNTNDVAPVNDDETEPEYPEHRNKRDTVYTTDATEITPDVHIEVFGPFEREDVVPVEDNETDVAPEKDYPVENTEDQQYRKKRDAVPTTAATEIEPDVKIEITGPFKEPRAKRDASPEEEIIENRPFPSVFEDNTDDAAADKDYPVENTDDQQDRKKRDTVPTTAATTEIEPDVKIEITGPFETRRAKRDASPEKHDDVSNDKSDELKKESGVARARRFSGDHDHEHEEDHEHAYPDCSCVRKHPHLPLFTNLHRHCQYPGKPRPTHPPCSSCGHTHPPKQPCHGHGHGAVYHHHHVHVVPQHHHAGPIHRVHHDVHHHFVPKRPHYRAPCDRPHHYDNADHHDQY